MNTWHDRNGSWERNNSSCCGRSFLERAKASCSQGYLLACSVTSPVLNILVSVRRTAHDSKERKPFPLLSNQQPIANLFAKKRRCRNGKPHPLILETDTVCENYESFVQNEYDDLFSQKIRSSPLANEALDSKQIDRNITMPIQVQPSRSWFSKPSSLFSKQKYVFHDVTGSSQKALLSQEQAQAQKDDKGKTLLNNPFDKEDKERTIVDHSNVYDYMYPRRYVSPSAPRPSEELFAPNLILSEDDLSTVSSDISLESGEEWEDEIWDLRDYPSAVTDYLEDSWTIEVYDRGHLAGDTVWFRASYNGITGYREFEDTEILSFIDLSIKLNSRFCFYVKTKFGKSDNETVSFFESDLILHALQQIRQRAECSDEIVIPTKSEILRKRKKKEKKCFLSWLFRLQSGVLDRKPQCGEI